MFSWLGSIMIDLISNPEEIIIKTFFAKGKQFPFYDLLKVSVHEVTDYENSNLFNCLARLFRCSICINTTIFC